MTTNRNGWGWVAVVVGFLIAGGTAWGDTVAWTNTAGDWGVGGNWDSGSPPGANDDVFITNAGASVVIASDQTVRSLTLAKTLTFTNWNTTLTASNVVVQTNGLVTHAGPFTSSQMSNNVVIVCTNLTVKGSGSINVSGKGFQGGVGRTPNPGPGYGTGGGSTGRGGGHGGRGGGGFGGGVYGSATNPVTIGSGGGGWDAAGGAGGGAIRIQASGVVTVDGSILADGNAPSGRAGAGSGGSIYLACARLTGDGTIRAKGGTWIDAAVPYTGGGGGRIAIVYDPDEQAGQTFPALTLSAALGLSFSSLYHGELGTLYTPDLTLIASGATISRREGRLVVEGLTHWSADSLLVTNSWLGFVETGLELANDLAVAANSTMLVTNALTVGRDLTVAGTLNILGPLNLGGGLDLPAGGSLSFIGGIDVDGLSVGGTLTVDGRLQVSGALDLPAGGSISCQAPFVYSDDLVIAGTLSLPNPAATNVLLVCGKGLVVTDGGILNLYSAPTNAVGPRYGGLVSVTNGATVVAANSTIRPYSSGTNGGSVFFRLSELTVAATGSFNADGRGFWGGAARGAGGPIAGFGTGGGGTAAGGGYGGVGAGADGYGGAGGVTYGYSNAPAQPGSGGGSWDPAGGAGGGLIWIDASAVTLDGILSANGAAPTGRAGSGSGGGIFITAGTFAGNGGTLSANGANGTESGVNGGGGGGRIAVAIGLTEAEKENLLNEATIPRLETTDQWPGFTGTLSVDKGTSNTSEAEDGTKMFLYMPPPKGTMIMLR